MRELELSFSAMLSEGRARTDQLGLIRGNCLEERTEKSAPKRAGRKGRAANVGPKRAGREGRQKSEVVRRRHRGRPTTAVDNALSIPSALQRSSRPAVLGPQFSVRRFRSVVFGT